MFNPKTILIYSGGEIIGDGLIKLPYINALRKTYPDAKITWLAGRGKTVYASLLKPLVEGILDDVLEDQGIGLTYKEIFEKPKITTPYDLIVDTQKRPFISPILKRIPHKVFLSNSCKGIFSSKLGVWFKKPPRHDVKRLFDLTSYAGRKLSLEVSKPKIPEAYLPALLSLLPRGKLYVGLAPGAGNMAGGRTKCWPLENYIQLASNQAKKGRIPVFILGPDEKSMLEGLKSACPGALFPLQDERADKSPLFTISLAQSLDIAISNDSGAGHMCSVAGIPLISLFGPTNPKKLSPLTPKGHVITAQLFGGSEMQDIPLDAVEKRVELVLGKDNPRQVLVY